MLLNMEENGEQGKELLVNVQPDLIFILPNTSWLVLPETNPEIIIFFFCFTLSIDQSVYLIISKSAAAT